MDYQDDVVELRIPRKPDYVSVARLAVSGIAGRMDFSYDEVEDIKLAMGEACTSAMKDVGPEFAASPLTVRYEREAQRLTIEVINPGGARSTSKAPESLPPDEPISRLLMEVLMAEVDVFEDADRNLYFWMLNYASREDE